MQLVSSQFQEYAIGDVRPLAWRFDASFSKVFDDSIDFFILDTSVLNGSQILAPMGANVLTEWQKYEYTEFTDKVISMEWTAELDFLFSVTASMADLTLSNTDNRFTKNADSPLEPNILPRRPIKLLAGFGNEAIPQFVGLTDEVPRVDRIGRTASLHARDFLSFIFERKLDQTEMFIDQRVDEILAALFLQVGVLPSQLILDKARTTVPFAFFEKDTTVGYAVGQLMKAEMGSLYMDEEGFIVFKNRLRQSTDAVFSFNAGNIIDYDMSDESNIINSVLVKAQVREVQPFQIVYSSVSPLKVPAGSNAEFFFQFEDPVVTLDTIDAYIANSSTTGGGTDLTSSVTVTDTDLFSTAVKVTFQNASAQDAFIITLNILGTPARITKNVNILEKDLTSIADFEEQSYTVESPYIQDTDSAESIALTLIRHFKDYGNTITLNVKGSPALQLSDLINVDIDTISDQYVIRKIENQMVDNRFNQRITAQKFEIPTYFQLDVSQLDGTDELAA